MVTKQILEASGREPSNYYQYVLNAAKDLPEDALFVEVGTQSGYSALDALLAIRESGKKRWFITVDPYGQKPYKHGVTTSHEGLDYGEQHYRNAMASLAMFSYANDLLHCHYRMTSADFRKYFDEMDFWYENGQIQKKFGFVYLDGEHDIYTMLDEFEWFNERLVPGGMIVIDDVDMVAESHDRFDTAIGEYDIRNNKLFYQKT